MKQELSNLINPCLQETFSTDFANNKDFNVDDSYVDASKLKLHTQKFRC